MRFTHKRGVGVVRGGGGGGGGGGDWGGGEHRILMPVWYTK